MKNLMEKINEGRQYRNMPICLRAKNEDAEEKDMIVEGYASTFNEPYTLYDDGEYLVEEQVDPKAFEKCDMSDVIFQYNHEGRVFARIRNNTLEVKADKKGLYIRANLGGTEEGRKLYQEIKEGYTDRMSFGFTVNNDEFLETHEDKKTRVLRTITEISKLWDVSAVSIPANDGTEISARSYCEGVIAELEAERQAEREKLEVEKAKTLALLNL